MDDLQRAPEGAAVPLYGPRRAGPADGCPAAGFVPLRLVFQPGGMAVDLTGPEAVLGRHRSADVRLPLPDVSRRHCRFVYTGEGWQVFDLNSLNGLYVNGQRVEQAALRPGDVVGVGSFRLKVEVGSADLAVPIGNLPEEDGSAQRPGETVSRLPCDPGRQRRAS